MEKEYKVNLNINMSNNNRNSKRIKVVDNWLDPEDEDTRSNGGSLHANN